MTPPFVPTKPFQVKALPASDLVGFLLLNQFTLTPKTEVGDGHRNGRRNAQPRIAAVDVVRQHHVPASRCQFGQVRLSRWLQRNRRGAVLGRAWNTRIVEELVANNPDANDIREPVSRQSPAPTGWSLVNPRRRYRRFQPRSRELS